MPAKKDALANLSEAERQKQQLRSALKEALEVQDRPPLFGPLYHQINDIQQRAFQGYAQIFPAETARSLSIGISVDNLASGLSERDYIKMIGITDARFLSMQAVTRPVQNQQLAEGVLSNAGHVHQGDEPVCLEAAFLSLYNRLTNSRISLEEFVAIAQESGFVDGATRKGDYFKVFETLSFRKATDPKAAVRQDVVVGADFNYFAEEVEMCRREVSGRRPLPQTDVYFFAILKDFDSHVVSVLYIDDTAVVVNDPAEPNGLTRIPKNDFVHQWQAAGMIGHLVVVHSKVPQKLS